MKLIHGKKGGKPFIDQTNNGGCGFTHKALREETQFQANISVEVLILWYGRVFPSKTLRNVSAFARAKAGTFLKVFDRIPFHTLVLDGCAVPPSPSTLQNQSCITHYIIYLSLYKSPHHMSFVLQRAPANINMSYALSHQSLSQLLYMY